MLSKDAKIDYLHAGPFSLMPARDLIQGKESRDGAHRVPATSEWTHWFIPERQIVLRNWTLEPGTDHQTERASDQECVVALRWRAAMDHCTQQRCRKKTCNRLHICPIFIAYSRWSALYIPGATWKAVTTYSTCAGGIEFITTGTCVSPVSMLSVKKKLDMQRKTAHDECRAQCL